MGHGFEPHRCHCVVSLSTNIYPSLVLVQHRKIRPFITHKQTNKQTNNKGVDQSEQGFCYLVSEKESTFYTVSKTCLKRPLKNVFRTDYRLIQVKSIAECSKGSILHYFRPSLSYHFVFKIFVFFSNFDRFYCDSPNGLVGLSMVNIWIRPINMVVFTFEYSKYMLNCGAFMLVSYLYGL